MAIRKPRGRQLDVLFSLVVRDGEMPRSELAGVYAKPTINACIRYGWITIRTYAAGEKAALTVYGRNAAQGSDPERYAAALNPPARNVAADLDSAVRVITAPDASGASVSLGEVSPFRARGVAVRITYKDVHPHRALGGGRA